MENIPDTYNVCFIISHKYNRNYKSYIKYYINNIQKMYSNSLCIIVDNNSKHIKDIIDELREFKNIIILTNVSACKFELGAYKVGIYYLLEKNLLNTYDYIVFSQDNYVLKNKFDFNYMKNHNLFGANFASANDGELHFEHYQTPHAQQILEKTNLTNYVSRLSICWCNSFILHNSKLQEFLDITKDIIITTRKLSEASERYLDAVICYFNNGTRVCLDNLSQQLSYDCWTLDPINDSVKECFAKKVQQKTENTEDI
jgi:hypothetical protein